MQSLTDNLSEDSPGDYTDSDDSGDEEDASGDSGDEEDDSDGEKPAKNPDEENEDSEEDLPVNLNKFKNVKIESPMPTSSSERKFHYNETKLCTKPSAASCIVSSPAGHNSGSGGVSPSVEESKDIIGDVTPVVRGRTRSFTKVGENIAYDSTSASADEDQDSRDDDGSGKATVARRVSWADQSTFSTSVSSMSEEAGNAIRIRYMASSGVTATDSNDAKDAATTATKETHADGEADKRVRKTTVITCPADLVKLASVSHTADAEEPTDTAVVSEAEGSDYTSSNSPAKVTVAAAPKKSILKKLASQDKGKESG